MVHKSRMCNLSEYLRRTGQTHEAFAKMVGVSRAHLTKIANGAAHPSRALMLRIEKATNGAVPVLAWFPTSEAAE